jgi:acetyl-CoA C-acetyltransferase
LDLCACLSHNFESGPFFFCRWATVFKKAPFKNFSGSVAKALGAKTEHKNNFLSYPGGNGPQYLISTFAEMLAKGELPQGPILVGGVEENAAFDRAVKSGKKDVLQKMGWSDTKEQVASLEKPTVVNKWQPLTGVGKGRSILASQFYHSGVPFALYLYPLFENAYANSLGRTAQQHLPSIADLSSRFSIVAAAHPEHSWYPQERTKDWLMTVSKENRVFGYPYRKWMCARDEVDQSAAVIMMSWAEAKRRGISDDKLVFIHGSGDAIDCDMVALRHRFDRSISMQIAYDEAFRSAGLGKADAKKIALFDIYSCFPVAVEQACDCVGLNPETDDVTRMTQTGGLAYHGGPGSNYSCHGLCALVEKLRLDKFRGEYGIVGANGGWLTEHSVGVYSTKPPQKTFSRRDLAEYKGDYALPMESFADSPNGKAKILTWTVRFERKSDDPETGIIIGEMVSGDDAGKRFFANTNPGDLETCQWLIDGNRIGSEVSVSTDKGSEIKFGQQSFFPVFFHQGSARCTASGSCSIHRL